MLIPASFKNPPSIPISPNSFSIKTNFSPLKLSSISFLISVVFPEPKNPEKISIFVISIAPYHNCFVHYITFLNKIKKIIVFVKFNGSVCELTSRTLENKIGLCYNKLLLKSFRGDYFGMGQEIELDLGKQ